MCDSSSQIAFQKTWILYLMHSFFSSTAAMWDIGMVMLLSGLSDNNLTLVACAGFLTNLFILLLMSGVGHFLDETDRLQAAKYALGLNAVAIATTYIICAYLSYLKESSQSFPDYFLYFIPFIGAIANLSLAAISTSVEKDWIVVLANNDSQWLSLVNSRMTQIDSACNAVVSVMTGFLFVRYAPSTVALILLTINIFTTIGLYHLLHNLYFSWNSLSIREQRADTFPKLAETSSLLPKTQRSGSFDEFQKDPVGYFHEFLTSGCVGTMISYAFLYLTVLNYGSLMVVYLRWSEMSDGWIGAGRGVGSVTGLLGATIFPSISQWLGIYRASNYALASQFILIVIACMSFIPSIVTYHRLELLCVTVLLSRIGLWMFDLGVRQIAQENIPEYCRGKVNGLWKSIISLFEMMSFIIAASISDPQYFWILAIVSTFMVGSALVLFSITRPDRYYHALSI